MRKTVDGDVAPHCILDHLEMHALCRELSVQRAYRKMKSRGKVPDGRGKVHAPFEILARPGADGTAVGRTEGPVFRGSLQEGP